MNLQELLLKLSRNKNISVECFCSDEYLTITLKEWYDFNTILQVQIDLNKDIDASQFVNYI